MKKFYEEKCKNIYWLRPAFSQQTFSVRSRLLQRQPSIKKRVSYASATCTLLLLLLFLILLSVFLLLASCLDLPISSGKSILFLKRTKEAHDFPLDCPAWNQTQTCPQNYPDVQNKRKDLDRSSSRTCPNHFRWIHEDLRHWRETGITRDMVDRANRTAHFRLVILNGKAYVEKFRKSIQTRDLFTLWGFVQLLRRYPGRVPDLELMFDCDDRPVINAKHYFQRPNPGPPPLFKYCSDDWSLDIVFPDWSFWGWPETNLKPWEIALKDIKEGNKRTKWKERVPYAYWRGNPHVAPTRADLLKCNLNQTAHVDWNTHIFLQDWINESKQGYKDSKVEDQCTYRYKIYIEGWAWSVSEKYILACNSPTLYVKPHFYNFFIRGMTPLKHFWPIRDNNKCKSLKFAVDWGNNHTSKAQEIGEASSRFIQEDLNMDSVYDYMLHLLSEYANLLKFKPTIPPNAMELCSESMACLADGTYQNFMMDSYVGYPTDTSPCTLPPPYDPLALGTIIDRKAKAIRQVEIWEDEFWGGNQKLNS